MYLTANFYPVSMYLTANPLHVLRTSKKNVKHVVVPVDPVKSLKTGRSESE